MSCLLLAAAVAAYGYSEMPAQINGAYWPSYNTSYCKAGEIHCTPQARVSSILNEPTGYGYSVTYNYGLQPEPAGRTWTAASSRSSGYNYGMK